MTFLQRCCSGLAAAFLGTLVFVSPAAAQTAPAATVVFSGTVRSTTGATVPEARITVSGPKSASTTTDANGAFSLTVPQGVYRVDVAKGGYNPASINELALVAGQTQPLAITLQTADLSSLQTIGHVSTGERGGGSTINTGSAATGFLSGQAFSDFANPQLTDTLQHLPDLNVQHMGSQPDNTIIVGGAQPYETQVLIDGHPIAVGQYGVWISQYFPSFLLGGAETQSGPGNTTPFANIAVGGTVNLLSPAFTRQPTAQLTVGVDNYQSQYANLLATGSAGKLDYVLGLGNASVNGPLYQTSRCIVVPENGGANDNTPAQAGVISSCGDSSGSFFSKGEVLKLRYNFTPTTSLETGFIGAWAGYSPQGTAWGSSLGSMKVENCLASNPLICNNPAYNSLVGSQVNGYAWYPGASVYNNQTIFDATLRTALGNDTLLVRPYVGNIQPEVILDVNQPAYAEWYGPAPGQPGYTAPTYPNGAAIPPGTFYFLGPNGNAFEQNCANSFYNVQSPANTSVVVNGQQECFGSPYATYEIDKLYGSTFSYIHPFGDSVLNFTYDFHGQSTFAYINDPSGVSVPLSDDRYTTFSLTSDLHLVRNLGINVGLYDTKYTVIGLKPQLQANGTPVTDAFGNAILQGFRTDTARFDPHLAFVFRPTNSLSYRASYGTSTTFPFVGQVSGLATYEDPASSLPAPYSLGGILTEKNPNLQPEVAIEEGLGVDWRMQNGSILSLDLQNNVIHNVFEQLTTTVAVPQIAPNAYEGVIAPINLARLRSKLATLRYTYAPRTGLGYNASLTADSAIADGLPPGAATFPVNNVQLCGSGVQNPGITTCIPYLKGYGQATYRWHDGTYMALGVDYEGKNNTYYQYPMELVDFTFKRPVSKTLELQVAAENLLNTNNYLQYLAIPNAGLPIVSGSAAGQTSYTPTAISAPARTIRLQLRWHVGR